MEKKAFWNRHLRDIFFIAIIIILLVRIATLINENHRHVITPFPLTYSSVSRVNTPMDIDYFAFSDKGEYIYTDTDLMKNYEGSYRKEDDHAYVIMGADLSGSAILLGETMYFYNEKEGTITKFILEGRGMMSTRYE